MSKGASLSTTKAPSSAMGSSCFLQSPCPHSLFASSSSHSSSLSPSHAPFFFSPRNARNRKKLRLVMARMGAETPNDSDICNRRLILFVGISVLPLLQLRARAFEASPAGVLAILVFVFLFSRINYCADGLIDE